MKLHVDFDAVFRGILDRDPHGTILLLYSPKQALWKDQLRTRLHTSLEILSDKNRNQTQNHRRDRRRILFLETMPYEDFLRLLSIADVMLDPFPFGGGVTTLDALAVGVYVLSLFNFMCWFFLCFSFALRRDGIRIRSAIRRILEDTSGYGAALSFVSWMGYVYTCIYIYIYIWTGPFE